jgi:hypothetical protein
VYIFQFANVYTEQPIYVSDLQGSYEDPSGPEETDTSILLLGLQDPLDIGAYESRELDLDDLERLSASSRSPIEGLWTGQLSSDDDSHGLVEVIIDTCDADGSIRGHARAFGGLLNIVGQLKIGGSSFEATFTYANRENGMTLVVTATLDLAAGAITGQWRAENTESVGTLHLIQTPVSIHAFKYPEGGHTQNRARALWSFACSAIRHHVQQRLGVCPWDFFKSRFRERKRFVELWRRQDFLGDLNYEEWEEMQSFQLRLSPSDARFYISLSRSNLGWSCFHL